MHQQQLIRTNDFALKLANVNGTGSASANGLLMQAIFRMGIPVSGKNLFPSNIQGLPTWYEVRVNKHGHTARAPGLRPRRRDERRDLRARRQGGPLGRLPALRLELAARPRARSRGRHLPRRPAGADVQRDLQGLARAHPDEEHRLPRRARGPARRRHGGHRRAARREVLQEEGAARLEPPGAARRLRLRDRELRLPAADPAREDVRDRRPDPDRRQHRHRARLPLRGRDGGRLVPDHAGHQRDGRVQGALREVPQGSRDRQEQLLHPPGRGRAGGDRDGDRRVLERRARVHLDGGPRHLAHERAHRPRLLRRDPRGDRRRAAHRPLDRACRPARSRGTSSPAPTPPTATPSTSCFSLRAPRSASPSRWRASISPSASRRRCSCCRTSTSA